MTTLAMNMGERLKEAGFVSLQGMLTIFLVLILLYLAIEVMHVLIARPAGSAKKKAQTELPAQTETVSESALVAEDDAAIIAAITAAITAMRADEGESGTFRVVSFARVRAKRSKN